MPEEFIRPQGGVDYRKPVHQVAGSPIRWADMVNLRPLMTDEGTVLVSDFGFTQKRNEVNKATHGLVKHLNFMAPSTQTREAYAVTNKRVLRDDGNNWTSIQDATDATAAETDMPDSMFLSDAMLFCWPVSGAANNIRKHTGGAGLVTVLGGTPRNTTSIRPLANRATLWGTFNGAVYQPTDFRYSVRDNTGSWNVNDFAPLTEQGDQAAGMEQLNNVLVLFRRFTSPIMVQPKGVSTDPFDYVPMPAGAGLANRGAFASCGSHGLGWCSTSGVVMFDGIRGPRSIGGPIAPMLFPLPAGSRVIGGYYQRHGEARETLYLFTNIQTKQNAARVPNIIETVNQYFGYDFASEQWFRGNCDSAPLAFGPYAVTVGDRDQANSSVLGSHLALVSANGAKIYDVNFDIATRDQVAIPRSAVTTAIAMDTFKQKRIKRIAPVFSYISSGSVQVSLFGSNVPGAIPAFDQNTIGQNTLNREILVGGVDNEKNLWVDFQDSGWWRFPQIRITTTSDVRLEAIWIDYDIGGY